MITFDEIRKEVALRHNVLIGKDDPILVTVTINELVLSHYLKLAADSYSQANAELSTAIQHQTEEAKKTAGTIITAASDYVASEIKKVTATAVTDAAVQIKHQVGVAQTVAHDALNASREIQAAKNAALISAVVAGGGALLAIFALIILLVK